MCNTCKASWSERTSRILDLEFIEVKNVTCAKSSRAKEEGKTQLKYKEIYLGLN